MLNQCWKYIFRFLFLFFISTFVFNNVSGQCHPTGSEKIISGKVFNDLNSNGLNDSEPGMENVSVRIYHDVNANQVIDASDVLLATPITDANGLYTYSEFQTLLSNFVMETDLATHPTGYALNTDNLESAYIVSGGSCDENNDFGFLNIDNDGDGIANLIDEDDDNDGILDIDEGMNTFSGNFGAPLDDDTDDIFEITPSNNG